MRWFRTLTVVTMALTLLMAIALAGGMVFICTSPARHKAMDKDPKYNGTVVFYVCATVIELFLFTFSVFGLTICVDNFRNKFQMDHGLRIKFILWIGLWKLTFLLSSSVVMYAFARDRRPQEQVSYLFRLFSKVNQDEQFVAQFEKYQRENNCCGIFGPDDWLMSQLRSNMGGGGGGGTGFQSLDYGFRQNPSTGRCHLHPPAIPMGCGRKIMIEVDFLVDMIAIAVAIQTIIAVICWTMAVYSFYYWMDREIITIAGDDVSNMIILEPDSESSTTLSTSASGAPPPGGPQVDGGYFPPPGDYIGPDGSIGGPGGYMGGPPGPDGYSQKPRSRRGPSGGAPSGGAPSGGAPSGTSKKTGSTGSGGGSVSRSRKPSSGGGSGAPSGSTHPPGKGNGSFASKKSSLKSGSAKGEMNSHIDLNISIHTTAAAQSSRAAGGSRSRSSQRPASSTHADRSGSRALEEGVLSLYPQEDSISSRKSSMPQPSGSARPGSSTYRSSQEERSRSQGANSTSQRSHSRSQRAKSSSQEGKSAPTAGPSGYSRSTGPHPVVTPGPSNVTNARGIQKRSTSQRTGPPPSQYLPHPSYVSQPTQGGYLQQPGGSYLPAGYLPPGGYLPPTSYINPESSERSLYHALHKQERMLGGKVIREIHLDREESSKSVNGGKKDKSGVLMNPPKATIAIVKNKNARKPKRLFAINDEDEED